MDRNSWAADPFGFSPDDPEDVIRAAVLIETREISSRQSSAALRRVVATHAVDTSTGWDRSRAEKDAIAEGVGTFRAHLHDLFQSESTATDVTADVIRVVHPGIRPRFCAFVAESDP